MADRSEPATKHTDVLQRPVVKRPISVLILGIVLIALGGLAVLLPQLGTLAVELVIGWLLVLSGFVHGWSAFGMHGFWRITGSVTVALLSLLAGALLLFNPMQGVLTLTLLLIAFFLAAGTVKIVYALQNRDTPGWGWALTSGIASLAVGVLVLLGWPSTAAWALGLLFGIDLVFSGASLVAIYPALKRAA